MQRHQFTIIWGVYTISYHELFGWLVCIGEKSLDNEHSKMVLNCLGYDYSNGKIFKRNSEQATDKSSEWRTANVYIWSPIFKAWIDDRQNITIRPNQSARELEENIAQSYIPPLPSEDVLLLPLLGAE